MSGDDLPGLEPLGRLLLQLKIRSSRVTGVMRAQFTPARSANPAANSVADPAANLSPGHADLPAGAAVQATSEHLPRLGAARPAVVLTVVVDGEPVSQIGWCGGGFFWLDGLDEGALAGASVAQAAEQILHVAGVTGLAPVASPPPPPPPVEGASARLEFEAAELCRGYACRGGQDGAALAAVDRLLARHGLEQVAGHLTREIAALVKQLAQAHGRGHTRAALSAHLHAVCGQDELGLRAPLHRQLRRLPVEDVPPDLHPEFVLRLVALCVQLRDDWYGTPPPAPD
ncbi:hypothetical protein [Actinomadura violacea]|uniref:Uncharacterized protein n=1 Tax=Actinomadura violacea TaxID=2819934 RepID=A0ABS3RZT1_9ACTN|nr:hypothetical protein [Actinomadura violacea]MBO2461530.1 hypothetical protein [Actinomadura violacea]